MRSSQKALPRLAERDARTDQVVSQPHLAHFIPTAYGNAIMSVASKATVPGFALPGVEDTIQRGATIMNGPFLSACCRWTVPCIVVTPNVSQSWPAIQRSVKQLRECARAVRTCSATADLDGDLGANPGGIALAEVANPSVFQRQRGHGADKATALAATGPDTSERMSVPAAVRKGLDKRNA